MGESLQRPTEEWNATTDCARHLSGPPADCRLPLNGWPLQSAQSVKYSIQYTKAGNTFPESEAGFGFKPRTESGNLQCSHGRAPGTMNDLLGKILYAPEIK